MGNESSKAIGPMRSAQTVEPEAIPPEKRLHSDRENRQSTQSLDKDQATAIVSDHALELEKSVESRVRRKIDMFLIPTMWIGYGLVYYDKVSSASHVHP